MHTIRSFIAIPLSAEVQRSARRLIRDLRRDQDGIKWVPEDNLHLTLKFLGDVVDREVHQVCQAIRDVCRVREPFPLTFSGVGGFPTNDRPRTLWAGITEGAPELIDLVLGLESSLAKLGFKPDSRDYRPHLALGRVKSGMRSANDEVVQRMNDLGDRILGTMQAEEVKLIASYLDRQGPTYNVMDTVPLGADADHEID